MPCSSGQFDNYGPSYGDIEAVKREIDELTAVFCEIFKAWEDADQPPATPVAKAWWEKHKKRDVARKLVEEWQRTWTSGSGVFSQ